MNKVFTTFEAAFLLGVAVKSVQTWIDQGRLQAGRTPGGHRRISAEDLIAFLRKQKLPIPQELVSSPPKILIIDSEPDEAATIAREIKAKYGDWEVVEAHDAFAAGQLMESKKPEAAILDLSMPGMDACEVCRSIRQTDTVRGTAVIAVMAKPSAKREKKIRQCGARACLFRPIDPDALLREVERALGKRA